MDIFQSAELKIKEAVQIASKTPNNPEGKLRELVSPIWDECLRTCKINLNFQPRDEVILANGRADTVYNRLILEYKKPYVINKDNSKNRKLISQVQGYIIDLAKEERWKEDRLLGVAFDGDHFLYLRRRKSNLWSEEEPIPVNAQSIKQFILYLEKLTSKAALIPDNLIKDFALGGDSTNFIASQTIKAFYFTILNNKNERVKVFFDQWAIQFSEVHGAIENKKFDAETLFKSYGFKKQEQKDFNFLAFFFALDTYYAVLMKLLAYQVVGYYVLKDVVGLPLSDWEKLDSDFLKEKLELLEEGGIFRNLGIRNFLEGDLLSWYLNDWNESIYQSLKRIIERLNQYDPQTMELVPDETRDILKKLYQFLVPKVIRHDLGEYYTPDWLAERCLDLVGYGPKVDNLLEKRILDPGCGSGTFVILSIKRAKEHSQLKKIDPSVTLSQITKNIMGFDLNPLAVISARTNYLLAVAELLPHRKGEITIPIYLCDSINPPSAVESPDLFGGSGGSFIIKTSVGVFTFPEILIKKEMIQKVTIMLEESVKKNLTKEKFIDKVIREFNLTEKSEIKNLSDILGETYLKLIDLEQKGINGIWARIIKNAFAPLFVSQFDFVVGNPPWVNWDALPKDYRDKLLFINQFIYSLFLAKGLSARHGSSETDLSTLMFYVSIDNYLVLNGKLCFVITQSLFQSTAASGFRQFMIKNKTPINVTYVDDYVSLQPFENATNRTAVLLATKGKLTEYPVPYTVWKKNAKGCKIDFINSLEEVVKLTKRLNLSAYPININEKTSPWLVIRPKIYRFLKNIIKPSAFKAHVGIHTGGANGVYWINIKSSKNDKVFIENMHDVGKKKVFAIGMNIEKEFVYPYIRGRDVSRWNGIPSIWIVAAQDPNKKHIGIEEKILKLKYPNTLEYFKNFENFLLERIHYKKYLAQQNAPFYSLYDIKEYTYAPYKVVWKYIATQLECCVISNTNDAYLGNKIILPDNKLMLIDFNNEPEAFYVCGLLNSSPVRFIVKSFIIGTQIAPHILNNLPIDRYDNKNKLHSDIYQLSKKCHEKSAAGVQVVDLEEQLDELAAELWGLTKQELKDIKDSLEELN